MKNECWVGKAAKSGEFKKVFYERSSPVQLPFVRIFVSANLNITGAAWPVKKEKERVTPPANFCFCE